jgi:hypothetical protein
MKQILILALAIIVIGTASASPTIKLIALGGDQVSRDIVGWLEGRISDENGIGIENLEVTSYCDGIDIGTDTTAFDGNFKIEFKDVRCGPGDEAWVEFDYLGQHYVSQRAVIFQFNPDKVKASILFGVPEFSFLTFGLAAMAAGLGFIFLRRA